MSLPLLGVSGKSGPFVYEPEVLAWSASTGIVDPYWLLPMNTAVVSLKIQGIWSKIIYCNPVAGGTAAAAAIPLKHPLGLASYIYGSPLVNNMGIKGDGVGTYIDTRMNIDPHIPSLYDVHSACYQNLASGFNTANTYGRLFGGYGIGQNPNADGGWTSGFCFDGSETNGFIDPPYNLAPSTRMSYGFSGADKWNGFIVANRTATNRAVFSRNGIILSTNTQNLASRTPNLSYGMVSFGRTNLWQRPFFWMASNNISNVNWDLGIRTQLDIRYVSLGRFAWFSNGLGLTDSQISAYNSIMQTLQTAWSRQV